MINKFSNFICILVFVLVFSVANAVAATPDTPAKPDMATQARASKVYGKLPLSIEANQGQHDPQVKFLSRGSGYTLFWTTTGVVLDLRSSRPSNSAECGMQNAECKQSIQKSNIEDPSSVVLRMQLVGADPALQLAGLEELPGKSNYFVGGDPKKWHTNIPTYARVRYQAVYPGVDLVFYGNQRQLEYDFIVAPGTDPQVITLGFQGADKLDLDDEGNLILHTGGGEIIQRAPVIYQEIDGLKQTISGRYVLKSGGDVGFQVAAYDASIPLVIDPILVHLPPFDDDGDFGLDITVDASGNAYVTGETRSADFPVTSPLQPVYGGGDNDAFVAKFNPTGSALVFSAYLGGGSIDSGNSITFDDSGNIYVIGWTDSNDFPTVNPLQPVFGGNRDAFVAKLNYTGSALIYSTYLGGGSVEEGRGIAIDTSGSVHVIGETYSTDFPMVNPLQATNKGFNDAFVAKLDPTGSSLVYSTYLGGNLGDAGRDIAVDVSGYAYITGITGSPDFPMANPLQPVYGGGVFDVFVAKLDPTGSTFVYSTYLGGFNDDRGRDIAIDASNNVYVTGFTKSGDFPTINAFQPDCALDLSGFCFGDAFVAKLDSAGSTLVYSTFLGGSSYDTGLGIAVDASGNAYVIGVTISNDFPTENPLQSVSGGDMDTFVAKLDAAGSALVYSTYLGGIASDNGTAIAVDVFGTAYVTGVTGSSDFPTVNPLQPDLIGSKDAFVAKINFTGSALDYSTYLGGSIIESGRSIALDTSGNAYVTGVTGSIDFPTLDPLQSGLSGGIDSFVLKLDPSGLALAYSTYLGGSGADIGHDIAVDDYGNAYVTGETESYDFPTASPIQPAYSGGNDVFVLKLDPTGSALVYSTFLGGQQDDKGHGIALDASGSTYVTGFTDSEDFPTANAVQPDCTLTFFGFNCSVDVFVTKLDPTGSTLVYSTYLGGSKDDRGNSIAVDTSGNAHITGKTSSSDFPTINALQPGPGSNCDYLFSYCLNAFVAKLDSAGSVFTYSTYLGGSDFDSGHDIAVDASGNAYITGETRSADFPTVSPLQPIFGGHSDAFVVKLDSVGSAFTYSTYLGGDKFDSGHGIAVDIYGNVYLTGETRSADFPTASPMQPALDVGSDVFVTRINAAGSVLVYSSYLGGNNVDFGSSIATDDLNNIYVTGGTSSPNFPITNPLKAPFGGSNDAFVAKINTGPEVILNLEGSGDQNIVSVSFINGSVTSRQVELKFWIDSPDLSLLHSILGVPTPVITLPPVSFTEALSLPLPGVLPFPDTSVGARFLEPITGDIMSESICMTVPCYGQMISHNGGDASDVGIAVSLTQDMIHLSLSNNGTTSKEVELKFWIDSPGLGLKISVLGVPTPVITLPPLPFTEVLNIPLPGGLPFPGTTVGGRLLNPVTGAAMSESVCTAVPCN